LAIIKPFRALRPVVEKAKQVACVPYDVVQKSEARAYVDENRLSFLRVTRPKSLYPKGEKPPLPEIFRRAKTNLDDFIREGIFRTDPDEALYVYQLAGPDHTQTGIVGCLSIDEYEAGVIKKHENVRPEKVQERAGHILALRAQTGLIFMAFRGTDAIGRLIADAVAGVPIYDFSGDDRIRQRFWKITDTTAWIAAFADVPSIYIADGHHRSEAARLAREKLRAENPSHTGNEEYNYVMAGVFPAEELRILPYNRVVCDLNGLATEEFLGRLHKTFAVTETNEKEPDERGEFCMYVDGRWFKLRSNVAYVREPDPVERLDATILQSYVLEPILGIKDDTTDDRLAFVGGARGTGELERLVDNGEAAVAFSLFPTSIEDMLEVSDRCEIMPPKSTWFDPKLKDGLLVHGIS
jgi:uncharacterized protein (DUF1015 family)